MKQIQHLMWIGLLLSVMALTVQAADQQQVIERITSADMKSLLHAEGFVGVTIDEDDDLLVKMNGFTIIVFVRGNDYRMIQYRFFITESSATVDDMNRWNAEKLFARAYIDSDGDPVLEMDVDLEGGVTIARIKDSIRTFSQLQIAFLKAFSA